VVQSAQCSYDLDNGDDHGEDEADLKAHIDYVDDTIDMDALGYLREVGPGEEQLVGAGKKNLTACRYRSSMSMVRLR